ncbi:MAG: hypothetical protein GY898_29485 [Proteobacteria bacterium]|nr:hypothetical protein [Pseudomonadota bacterium]
MRVLALLAVGLLVGCFGDDFTEVEPLDEADSPCYRANLADGLSETDPGELLAIYECLNVRGALDGADGVVRALTTAQTRADREGSLDLARAVNRIPEHVDVSGSLTAAADLLRERNEFLVFVARTTAEWIYGRPWPEVEAAFADGGGELTAPEAVEDGLVQPLIPIVATLAESALDAGELPAIAAGLESVLTMQELAEVTGTMATMVQDQEAALLEHTIEDLATFLESAQEPGGENVLLRLVAESLTGAPGLGGQPPLIAALDPLDRMLADPVASDRMATTIGELYADGVLQALPGQLHSLITIDVDGNGWAPGRETALQGLLKLLEDGDQPVQCGLIFQVDSLSMFIFQAISLFDASTVETSLLAADLLVQDLMVLTDLLCTGIDPGLQERYPAILRLAESGALRVTTPLVQSLYAPLDPEHDTLREGLDLLLAIQSGGLTDEVEDFGRRELDEPFIGNVMTVVGAFVEPEDPAAVGDLDTMIRVLRAAISPPAGQGYERSLAGLLVEPLRVTLTAHEEELADWLAEFAGLLRAEGSQTSGLLDEVAPLLEVDPDLDTLAAVGRLLGDVELSEPMWRVLETDEVAAALASSTNGREAPGMLGLVGRISADGSLEQVLSLMTWLLETVDGLGLLPE